MSFAANLKALRSKAGMSQEQLAEKAGLHRFGIAKLEQGVREPSWQTVQALAAALGVDCTVFQMAPPAAGRKVKRGRPKKKDGA